MFPNVTLCANKITCVLCCAVMCNVFTNILYFVLNRTALLPECISILPQSPSSPPESPPQFLPQISLNLDVWSIPQNSMD